MRFVYGNAIRRLSGAGVAIWPGVYGFRLHAYSFAAATAANREYSFADSACACRKPQPGMLLEVARRFNISLKDTYMVGDAHRDVAAAAAAGTRPVLVLTERGRRTRDEGNLPAGTEVFEDLAAFAEHVAP